MNVKGLRSVKSLLNALHIKSNITGPNVDKSWYLTISGAINIINYQKIGFDHPKKKKSLDILVTQLIQNNYMEK